ncbi:hypothetical protein [Streptoalloteichus hindustanus]|uniref:Uncharacterized protein n=1 Tax=Streptoalloteichus hindustanus TaxID=2017 RepID=A0A1M5GJU1_STRHI|nr:hypothetical protein [Streptoalloteichus hindustanus]SHG03989.1 hypothetical protein SAMN05444320_106151 [Streptoalloteichus hindustanus]
MFRTFVAALGAALSLSLAPASAVADPPRAPAHQADAPVASDVSGGSGIGSAVGPRRDDVRRQLAAARAATGRFRDLRVALDEGYAPMGQSCLHSPEGGMGRHYIKPEFVGLLDPLRPTILVYDVDPDSKTTRDLVALEWVKWDEDQDVSTDDDRPSLFGVPFDGPFERVEDMPARYDLHAWVWKHNPSGTFARWNPTVTC